MSPMNQIFNQIGNCHREPLVILVSIVVCIQNCRKDADAKSEGSVRTLTNEDDLNADSSASATKSSDMKELDESKPFEIKSISDLKNALTDGSSIESLETKSMNGKKGKKPRVGDIARIMGQQLSASQQTLTNVSLRFNFN